MTKKSKPDATYATGKPVEKLTPAQERANASYLRQKQTPKGDRQSKPHSSKRGKP
jgi:hypothetical protein